MLNSMVERCAKRPLKQGSVFTHERIIVALVKGKHSVSRVKVRSSLHPSVRRIFSLSSPSQSLTITSHDSHSGSPLRLRYGPLRPTRPRRMGTHAHHLRP